MKKKKIDPADMEPEDIDDLLAMPMPLKQLVKRALEMGVDEHEIARAKKRILDRQPTRQIERAHQIERCRRVAQVAEFRGDLANQLKAEALLADLAGTKQMDELPPELTDAAKAMIKMAEVGATWERKDD